MNTNTDRMEEFHVYVCFRPYLFMFLSVMSKLYEIIVFTAGTESYDYSFSYLICRYASEIVKLLNEKEKVIRY